MIERLGTVWDVLSLVCYGPSAGDADRPKIQRKKGHVERSGVSDLSLDEVKNWPKRFKFPRIERRHNFLSKASFAANKPVAFVRFALVDFEV